MNEQKYRADIDGLRAVAVLSIILFHINENILPGGFVGVDIFFVISGYLISLHIFRDIKADQFSLIEFYRRRVKRIAPALLCVVSVTVTAAQFLFRPEDAEKVAESSLWSLLSLANLYFWLFQDTSYFAASSNELPLLHLWSLGVEEQFYIFWPLILMAVYKTIRGSLFVASVVLVSIGSFALGEFYFEKDPSFVYYMLPTRVGELLTGAFVAHIISTRKIPALTPRILLLLESCGVMLLAASLILLSEENVFPGFQAIPPTLGAAILLFSGHYDKSRLTPLLTLKPLVWIGLISYSAYLWHWPLLAFFRYGQFDIGILSGTLIFAVTILLAWLTYKYVEQPFRLSPRPAIQIFLRQYIIPVGIIAFASLVFMKIDGYGLRWFAGDYKEKLASIRESIRPAYDYDYVCQKQRINNQDVQDAACLVGKPSGSPTKAFLWGDSNAAHYIGMLGAFADEREFQFRNLQLGSCPPLYSDPEEFVSARRLADCRDALDVLWPALESYQIVIISASWSSYQKRSEKFLDTFFETAQMLVNKGKTLILIGKAPIISTYNRLCREKAMSFPLVDCESEDVPLDGEVAAINEKLAQFADKTQNVEYYDANNYLCPNKSCSAFNGKGEPIYYDSSHLGLPASWKLGKAIIKSEGVPFPFSLIVN